jgi:hypothetical protein
MTQWHAQSAQRRLRGEGKIGAPSRHFFRIIRSDFHMILSLCILETRSDLNFLRQLERDGHGDGSGDKN